MGKGEEEGIINWRFCQMRGRWPGSKTGDLTGNVYIIFKIQVL